LTARLDTATTKGTVALNADGSYTYTPAPDFSGSDSFTYHANDGLVDSGVATVTITVTPVNDAPAATDDACTTDADTDCAVPAPGVLGNDNDPDGDSLTATLDTAAANGTVALNADGSYTYTPDSGFSGTDAFTCRATDGLLDSSPATVTITVTPPPATTTTPTTTTTTPTTTPTTTTPTTTTTPPPPQQQSPAPVVERDTLAPTAPAPLNGRLVRGQRGFVRTSLALSWSSSTDNVGVDRYELARNDAVVQILPSSAATATVALRGNATYALGALDPAGNRSERPTVTVERRARPAVRASIPAWSWRLLAWRATPRTSRGPRPAAPRHVPDWYCTWAAWRLNPYRIVS
jgi:VCBS repeat-containing protein